MRKIMIAVLIISVSMLGACGGDEEDSTYKVSRGEKTEPAQKAKSTPSPSSEKTTKGEQPSAEPVLIADFNNEERKNNLGATFGAWDKDTDDNSQTASETLDFSVHHGQSGGSLKLFYDVDSPNPAYNGLWMKLKSLPTKGHKYLTFWIKGDPARGFSEVCKIELKGEGTSYSTYIRDIGPQWKKEKLSLLGDFNITEDITLSEFVLVFEDQTATTKEGVIYLDDVKLK